jgi:hypothetical protein
VSLGAQAKPPDGNDLHLSTPFRDSTNFSVNTLQTSRLSIIIELINFIFVFRYQNTSLDSRSYGIPGHCIKVFEVGAAPVALSPLQSRLTSK